MAATYHLPPHPKYHRYLIEFMSFVDGRPYPKDATFAPAILGAIQPEQIVAWMKKKAYGTSTPSHNDRPTVGRSSSLEYYKRNVRITCQTSYGHGMH